MQKVGSALWLCWPPTSIFHLAFRDVFRATGDQGEVSPEACGLRMGMAVEWYKSPGSATCDNFVPTLDQWKGCLGEKEGPTEHEVNPGWWWWLIPWVGNPHPPTIIIIIYKGCSDAFLTLLMLQYVSNVFRHGRCCERYSNACCTWGRKCPWIRCPDGNIDIVVFILIASYAYNLFVHAAAKATPMGNPKQCFDLRK